MDTAFEPIIEKPGQTNDEGDTDTASLIKTLTPLFIIISIYLAAVVKFIPTYMKNKPPYQLKKILLLYNALQVAYSVYLVLIYGRYIFRYGIITTRCPKGHDLQDVIDEIYPYFIAKHLDLLDTVFFTLRKKDNQITFLHLYHHTAMLSWTWFHLRLHPTDNFVVVGLLNSFVHVLMYAYYGISSLGPEYAKYVWWKKHLTKVQLMQFILVVLNLYYQQELSPCPIPMFFHNFCNFLIISFFILFLKFYFDSYSRRNKNILERRRREQNLNIDDHEIKGR